MNKDLELFKRNLEEMEATIDGMRTELEEAKKKNIRKVLLGAHTSNIGSCRVIEKCGGILENVVKAPDVENETINRYWIENM